MTQLESKSEEKERAILAAQTTLRTRFVAGRHSKLARFARSLGKPTLITTLVLLILFLAGWFLTPIYLVKYFNQRGSEFPDYKLHINSVEINPLTCSIDLYGLHLAKPSNEIPVPFLTAPRLNVAMQYSEILHWSLRSNIVLYQPVINFVQGPTEATTQTVLEPAWVTAVKQMVPLQINRFAVRDGDVHFYDFHADPEIDMELDQLELSLDNLTNSNHTNALMPSTAV